MILGETVSFKASRSVLLAAGILALLALPSWSQAASDSSGGRGTSDEDAAAAASPRQGRQPGSGATGDAPPADATKDSRQQSRLESFEARLQQLMAELRALKAERAADRTRSSSPGRRRGKQSTQTRVASAEGRQQKMDLEQVQGLWVRRTEDRNIEFGDQPAESRRTTKEVEGDTETVTYYNVEGKVLRAHTAKIQLQRAGPIRIFTISDITHTAGPKLGQTEEGSKAYIYKVVDDVFVEIWGVLDESDSRVRALRWERERSEE